MGLNFLKRKCAVVLIACYCLIHAPIAYAQIYLHNFGTTAISSHPYTVAPVAFDSHLSNSSWSNSTNAWSSNNGATGEAIRLTSSTAASVTLTFDVAPGYQVEVTSFDFWRQRSNSGPQNWAMAINGINVGAGTIPTSGAAVGGTAVANPVSGLTGTVTVTLSLTGPTGNGTFRLDDFKLNGSVTPNCTAPVISSFSPTTGPQNTLVTINGSGFLANTGTGSVKFGGVDAASFTVVSDNLIKAYTPGGAISGNITLITNGCEGTSAGTFTSIVSQPAVNYSTDIYISEVHDTEIGSGGIIEIYNGTAFNVDISAYSIRRYGDINDVTPTYDEPLTPTIPISPILAPGQIYLFGVGTSATDCTGITFGHFYPSGGFNSNDEFELVKNGAVIDDVQISSTVITGQPGYSITRNPDAVAPKVIFNASDWNLVGTETCADIGVHAITTNTLPAVSNQPVSKSICENANTSFSLILAAGTGFTYQWKVYAGSGTWTNVTNSSVYSGANSNTLTLTGTPLLFADYQYYCEVTSAAGKIVSHAAQLEVNAATTIPTFDSIPAICSGETLSPLPTTSQNGITGSWSPALSNTSTTIYTFTPDAGQCATTTTLTITVNMPVTPTFNSVPAICAGDALSPLLTTSQNGITGSWSPALSNTSTTIYTFTPDAGQCATTATLTITVNNGNTIPTFNSIPAICAGDALSPLPTTSQNGITGSWSPALSNTSTTIYTFTPDAGQ
uniref:IPT/TIG domain-containing protein n=1 Tax=Flavobacterium sp. TaxID=239 RepID=UPI002611BE68